MNPFKKNRFPGVFIHKTATIEDGVKIGHKTKIWHHTHVRLCAEIGEDCTLGKNVFVDELVEIGSHSKIQNNVNVYHGVSLGSYVFVGPNATFTNDKRPRAWLWDHHMVKKTVVGTGASIGAGAVVCPGVNIGEYSMVGAGAVVVKDVPAFALVVGNPAKQIGEVNKDGERLSKPKKA